MYDFLFIDEEVGEEFFVECDTLAEAWETVYVNFGQNSDVHYLGKYTIEEAEILGYDTY